MDEISKIEGLDIEDGLKRLKNNKTLYKRLLVSFLNSDMIAKLNDSIIQNDIKTAKSHAHSIKGTGANLGLITISDIAAEIDNMLKHDNSEITPECLDLLSKLIKVFASVKEKINDLKL